MVQYVKRRWAVIILLSGVMACWSVLCLISTEDVSASRWNYKRHGPFQASVLSISPDGQLVLFDSARTGKGDIYSADRGGSNVQALVSTPATESDPTFTWDGQAFAFARQTGGYQHLWLYRFGDKTEVQLTTGRVIDVPVSITSNGIIFRRTTFYGRLLLPESELFEIATSNSVYSITHKFGAVECVSPDGKRFVRKKGDAESGRDKLWIENRDGSVTHRIGVGSSPSFSPDGKRIVYLSQTPDYRSEVMLINSDGTNLRRLPTPAGYKTTPRFCMDGTAVCFRIPSSPRDGPGGAYIVHLEDAHAEKLSAIAGEPIY